MTWLTARPDDLSSAPALLAADVAALAAAGAVAESVSRDGPAALGSASALVSAALDLYGRLDAQVAGALRDAVELLGTALADAGDTYGTLEASVGRSLSSAGPP